MSPNIDIPDNSRDLTRSERERQARRRDIIEAARAVFACNGFDKATLGDVARRAEYGTGTIYNYFPNKERLFECVIEEAFVPILGIAEETLGGEETFDQRITRFVDRELTYFFEHPATLRLLLREAHQLREQNPMLHLTPRLLATIANAIADEQRTGRIVDDLDPQDLATALLNLLYGQFISRVYKNPKAMAAKGSSTLEGVFKPLPQEERDREITRMSRLIRVLFLGGTRPGAIH